MNKRREAIINSLPPQKKIPQRNSYRIDDLEKNLDNYETRLEKLDPYLSFSPRTFHKELGELKRRIKDLTLALEKAVTASLVKKSTIKYPQKKSWWNIFK